MLASVNFNSGTGALVVVGNAIADTISLTNSADHQSFTVDINNNSSLQQTFNYSDVTSLRVVAGDGDDFVYNDLLMDTEIFGQNGNDRLEGGYANDLVMGGNGIDILVGRHGDDVLNGQDGNDWLFGGPGVDDLSGITGNDNLYGGTGDDTLNGHGGNDSLWGEDGNDSLLGGAGDDLLRGQDGDDTIKGEAGDDWLVGGDGDDTLQGDAGIDELLGQNGNDILNGGADNDFIWGAAGDDTIRGNSGSDRLNGGSGNDLLLGNEGRDIIRGDGGDDTLYGGDGDDDLFGLGGTDTIFGDAGDDLLDAGGDVAADVLTGGSGLDRFVVLGNFGSTSVDVINDLEDFEPINGVSSGGNSGVDPSGTGSIGDLVFEDSNDNQQFDAGEVGIGDVTLTLFSGTTAIATRTTNDSGQYTFDGLAAGDYRVELLLDGLTDYEPTTPNTADVSLVDGQANTSVDFGVKKLQPGGSSADSLAEDLLANIGLGFLGTISAGQLASYLSGQNSSTFTTSTGQLDVVESGFRKQVFRSTSLGPVTQVSYVGDFPSFFPDILALELASLAIPEVSTIHLIQTNALGDIGKAISNVTSAILLTADGGVVVGSEDNGGVLNLLPSPIPLTPQATIGFYDQVFDNLGILQPTLQSLTTDVPSAQPAALQEQREILGSLGIDGFYGDLLEVITESRLSALTNPQDPTKGFFINDQAQLISDVLLGGPGDAGTVVNCIGGGFDCDDYADAAINYLSFRKSQGDLPGGVDFAVWGGTFEQIKTKLPNPNGGGLINGPVVDPNSRHAVVVVFNEGEFYGYDPQSNYLSRAFISPQLAVQDAIHNGYTFSREPVRDIKVFTRLPLNDPNGPPFYTVPDFKAKFIDALNRAGVADTTPYLPN